MSAIGLFKPIFALALTLAVLLISSTEGQTAGGATPVVTITAVSGFAGHAFVYAEVVTSSRTFPAPTGTSHQTPYVAEWVPVGPGGACPWIWAVYVYNRATNALLNPSPPNSPPPDYGTTTLLCPSASKTPVGQPPMPDASARLDLDLQVSVSPASAVAGSSTLVSAVLSSTLTADLNLYLNLAIEDWHVDDWFLDFGDGASASFGGGTTAIAVPHTYQAAGQYDVRAIASISGHAQAAIYDRTGRPQLIQQGFALQIGNHASASARAQAVRRYLPPAVGIGISPALSPLRPDPAAPALAHVNTVRGRLTAMAVRLLVFQEGRITVDGRPAGSGQSRLVGWRLDGAPSDAPAGTGTSPGIIHPPTDLLSLQWNSPDRIGQGHPQDYVVAMTLFVQTQFSDGRVATYSVPSSFPVSVNFPAESG